jgi:hypothetical protein
MENLIPANYQLFISSPTGSILYACCEFYGKEKRI